MDRRSQQLVYGREDRLPATRLIGLALQHLILLLMFLVYPVMAGRSLGLEEEAILPFLTMAILTVGIGTMVQSLPSPWGSGYLHVHQPSPIFLPLAAQALPFGGLAALAPLLFIAGVSQVILAQGLHLLRRYLPPEVMGVVVALLGISLVPGALTRCLEQGVHGDAMTAPIVAGITLATMISVAIYSRGPLRLFSLIIGAGVGILLSAAFGLFAPSHVDHILGAPLFALPVIEFKRWAFNWNLLPLVALITCVQMLDSLGTNVSAQKLADADWQRTNMDTARLAIRSVGVGNMLAGLFGGYPAGISSASVGLSFTSGAVAWRIGVLTGFLGITCAFVPKIMMFLAILPEPVVGAIVLNAAAFMIVAGMELIFSRMLNTRRIFMVGLSIIAGLGAMLRPELGLVAPEWMKPAMGSPLFVGSMVAVALNLIFRIGISEQERLEIKSGDPLYVRLRDFFERKGEQWGLSRRLVDHAQSGTMHAVETLFEFNLLRVPKVEISLRYDDMRLEVIIAYDGEALPFGSKRPTPEEMVENSDALLRMTSYIVAELADGCQTRTDGTVNRIELRFDS
jgi:xanthine/uracil permease